MNDEERFELLDELYCNLDDQEDLTGAALAFHHVYEAIGGADGDGILHLWTAYFPKETQQFIESFEQVGFPELASRLRELDLWLSKVDGVTRGSPNLSGDQTERIESLNGDFERLTPDREKIMYDYVIAQGIEA